MQIALISDIHGNLVALEAAMAAIDALHVDHLVCLGDVASMGAQPHETLRYLANRNFSMVMGNTDANLLNPPALPDNANEFVQRFITMNGWCAAQLTTEDRNFIQSFQPTITLPLANGRDLLCFHGSPRSYDDIIRATTTNDELATCFEGTSAWLLAGGHTHDPLWRRCGQSWIINPGSVGLPVDFLEDGQAVNIPRAEFAVIDVTGDRFNITFRHVAYDPEPLLQAIRDREMPYSDWFINEWRRADGTSIV